MAHEIKRRYICQRCGGQLIRSYDDISCLQCGATPTEEGELESNRSAQKFEAPVIVPENPLSETKQPPKRQRREGQLLGFCAECLERQAETILDFMYAIFLWIVFAVSDNVDY